MRKHVLDDSMTHKNLSQVLEQCQKSQSAFRVKMASKRKGLTLDLNSASNKKAKAASHILTSPDVQMLKLTSPELAKFLTSNPTLQTPTPSGNNILFPKTVTEEQEIYAKGFEVALQQLKQGGSSTSSSSIPDQLPMLHQHPGVKIEQPPLRNQAATSIETIERATAAHAAAQRAHNQMATEVSPRPSSSASGSMDSSEFRIKEEIEDDEDLEDDSDYSEEEEIVPNNSRGRKSASTATKKSNSTKKKLSMTPINMESQEQIKLERKRQRNRLAASKCRKRKLERISHLEGKVKDLKSENGELANVVKKLKESVYQLKQEVIEHHNNGCMISMVGEEVVYPHNS